MAEPLTAAELAALKRDVDSSMATLNGYGAGFPALDCARLLATVEALHDDLSWEARVFANADIPPRIKLAAIALNRMLRLRRRTEEEKVEIDFHDLGTYYGVSSDVAEEDVRTLGKMKVITLE